MKTEYRDDFLGTDPIGKLLFKLSLPATVAIFVNILYNFVDTIFIGRGVGADAIGGLVIIFPFQIILMAVGTMFGVGAASIISRSLGAGDRDGAAKTTGNTIVVAVIVSVIIMIAVMFKFESLLVLFGATEGLIEYAGDYLSIILWGAPFIVTSLVLHSIIQAEGNAKSAMMGMLISTVINIILDPLFIFGFGMGIKGAALATVIAQFFWFLHAIHFFYSSKSIISLKTEDFKLKGCICKDVVILGIPSFVRHSGGSIVMIIINQTLGFYGGDIYITIVGVVFKIVRIIMAPILGIAQGFKPIIGYNYGAKNYVRVKETLKYAITSSFFIAFAGFVLMFFFPHILLKMVTSDHNLIEKGIPVMRIIVLVIPIIGIQLVGTEFFLSIGKGLPALLLGLSRQIILLIPLMLILPRFWGVNGVFVSYPIADFLSTIITFYLLVREVRKLDIQQKDEEAESLITINITDYRKEIIAKN